MFQMLLNISFYNLHNTKGRSLIAKKKITENRERRTSSRTMIHPKSEGKSNNVNIFKIIEISDV